MTLEPHCSASTALLLGSFQIFADKRSCACACPASASPGRPAPERMSSRHGQFPLFAVRRIGAPRKAGQHLVAGEIRRFGAMIPAGLLCLL